MVVYASHASLWCTTVGICLPCLPMCTTGYMSPMPPYQHPFHCWQESSLPSLYPFHCWARKALSLSFHPFHCLAIPEPLLSPVSLLGVKEAFLPLSPVSLLGGERAFPVLLPVSLLGYFRGSQSFPETLSLLGEVYPGWWISSLLCLPAPHPGIYTVYIASLCVQALDRTEHEPRMFTP